jgi:tetratricopeptide (TPR) repeat protein
VVAVLRAGTWAALFAWAVRRRALVPCLALLLAVLPLTPALMLRSLNQGLENAFAERYLYLSSFGVVLAAGWVVSTLAASRLRLARAITGGLAVLAVIGAVATVQRNPVFKDSVSLWGDTVRKSPESGSANVNYGFALISAGQADAGRRYVQRGVSLAPDLVERAMRRGVSYAQSGRAKDAVLAFHNVLVMASRSSDAHYNLAVLYEEQRQIKAAIDEYEAAIAADPGNANAHNNVGILYFTAGQQELGLGHLERAVRLRPDDPGFRANFEKARQR